MLYILLQLLLVAILAVALVFQVAVSILVFRLVGHNINDLIRLGRVSAEQRRRAVANLRR